MTPDLGVGPAKQRIELARVDRRHAGTGRARTSATRPTATAATSATETGAEVELARLPGPEPLGQLLRKAIRVGGGRIGLVRQHRRRLVMLPAPAAVRAHPCDDVGPQGPDHPHEVAQDLLAAPLLECLVPAEGVTEVDSACEVLFRPVEAMGRQQLLGA